MYKTHTIKVLTQLNQDTETEQFPNHCAPQGHYQEQEVPPKLVTGLDENLLS